jgi:hypothetical protein
MPDEEWIKKLEDGRKVKFIYQELPEDGAFMTAQIEGNEVVYSVVLAKARNPLSREDVESRFKGELEEVATLNLGSYPQSSRFELHTTSLVLANRKSYFEPNYSASIMVKRWFA